MQKILNRVAGQVEFGEDCDGDTLVRAGAGLTQHRVGVAGRIGDYRARSAGRDADKSLLVDAAEIHDRTSVTHPSVISRDYREDCEICLA
jgi:hypothetical protein